MGSGREAHGKENPRKLYAVGLPTEPAPLVRGSSRRITIMRFRPANSSLRDCKSLNGPTCSWYTPQSMPVAQSD